MKTSLVCGYLELEEEAEAAQLQLESGARYGRHDILP